MEQDVETIHFHEGKLKVYPQVVKSHSQAFRKDQLSTARPHRFHFLLWIDLLFQYLYGISQCVVLCHVTGYLLGAMYNGGMVPSSQVPSDSLERSGRHIPAQVHDDLLGYTISLLRFWDEISRGVRPK